MISKKVAIITGGASGIGAATANQLVKKGCRVYVIDISCVKSKNIDLIYYQCDVSSYDDVRKTILDITKKEGKIDYLFACAGIHINANIEEVTMEQFDRIMRVNVYGTFHIIKEVIPIMRNNGYGNIVLMGSDQSIIAKSKNIVYGATKGAIAQMTKGLALDYADFNIRVNCVCPGTIDTPMFRNAVRFSSKKYNKSIDSIIEDSKKEQPIKRLGSPEEVANVVVFLLSDESSYMTGTLISIDGGYTCI